MISVQKLIAINKFWNALALILCEQKCNLRKISKIGLRSD